MTTVSFPARCAVAVICGEHLVSQVYPASVPVEAFIDDVVELLNDDLKRRGVACIEAGRGYELQLVNGTRLDATRTLDDLGIEDGSTLMLAPARPGESFEPQYESLSTGLAYVGRQLFAPVDAQTALATALAILGGVVLTVLGLACRARLHTDAWATALVPMAFGAVMAIGAFAVWKWWPASRQLSNGLAWLAIPLLAVGCALATPGALSAAHVFIAALAAAVMTFGLASMTQGNIVVAATVVTVCVVGGVIAGVRMWQAVPAQRLGMCTLIGLLVLITAAPTVALLAARIRPPHFGSITGRDLFRRNDGMPVDAVAPVGDDLDEGPDRDITPRGTTIAAAARRANSVLTGIAVAVAVCLPPAVWFTLLPEQPHGVAAACLVVLFSAIFISRGRAFSDRRQAVALVVGATAAVCSGVARLVVNVPAAESVSSVLWAGLGLAAFGTAGLVAALLVPVTRFTPLVRMLAEWVELLAIVVALPLTAWIGGLFDWVRMR